MMFHSKKTACYKLLLFFVVGLCFNSFTFGQDRPKYQEGSLYIKFKDESQVSAKKMLTSKSGSPIVYTSKLGLDAKMVEKLGIMSTSTSLHLLDDPFLDKTFKITIDPQKKIDIDKVIKELEKDPNVEYVEKVPADYILSVNPKEGETWTTPNDPFYSSSYGSAKLNLRWHLDLINAEQAWAMQKGKPSIKVAVVDNAVWGAHEDLKIPAAHLFNCRTGQVGSANPPSEVNQNMVCTLKDLTSNPSTCYSYDFSHGTHCAGAVAAINNNGIGIASMGGGVTLLGAGGSSMSNPSSVFGTSEGVSWAANNGAKVISCSWGNDTYSTTQKNLMKACYEKGIIIVAAAGNDNTNTTHYPSGYYPYVICVGSVDADKEKSSFSNYGSWVTILSPGGIKRNGSGKYTNQIFSTTFCQNQLMRLMGNLPDFDNVYYDDMQGTSMATPVASGVVSLLVSKDSTLNTDEVRTILQNSSLHIKTNSFNAFCGIIDASAALKYMDTMRAFGPMVPSLSARSEHDTVWLNWEAPKTDETVLGYNLYRNGTIFANSFEQTSYVDTNLSSGVVHYSVEPIYANLQSIRSEAIVTVKRYFGISILIRPENGGTVEGEGTYEANKTVFLKATPATGFMFDHWENAAAANLGSGETLPVKVSSNVMIFAFFEPDVSKEDLAKAKKGFSLSPNPASGEVKLYSENVPMLNIVISDANGRVLLNKKTKSNEEIVSVENWPNGLYIVKVTTIYGDFSEKLIKKN